MKDPADFLVGDEAFGEHDCGLVALRPDVSFWVNRVALDLIGAEP